MSAAAPNAARSAPASSTGPVLVRGTSARALEARLLAELQAACAAARRDPRLLAQPVRVVVPSADLRHALNARIARDCDSSARIARDGGSSALGVRVDTLRGLARAVHAACGEAPARGEELALVYAERAARAEPALAGRLAAVEGGLARAAQSVRDLLSAGLLPENEPAACAALRALPGERTLELALVRAACNCARALAADGLALPGAELRRAAQLVRERDALALPARALHVYGFGDAAGPARALLSALCARANAQFYLELPTDPVARGKPDPAVQSAAEGFARRVAHFEHEQRAPEPAPAVLASFDAVGARAELREALARAGESVARGLAPERIALVARTLGAHAPWIALECAERGLAFSGPRAALAMDPPRARVAQLVELSAAGARTPLEHWFALCEHAWDGWDESAPASTPPALRQADLQLGLATLGFARVEELASADLALALDARAALPLPARLGAAPEQLGDTLEDAEGEVDVGEGAEPELEELAPAGESSAPSPALQRASAAVLRRSLPSAALMHAQRLARDLRARAERLQARHNLGALSADLRELARASCGWSSQSPHAECLERLLERLAQLGADELPLAGDEFRALCMQQLAELEARPLGGLGGGLQVLDALHARGLCFDEVHVLGLERDAFPRRVSEDFLLPDDARAALRPLLPDLHLRLEGQIEERALFAQLCGSAARVGLSWQRSDEDGRELCASTFVERLRLHGVLHAHASVPRERRAQLAPPWCGTSARPRSARESLECAALAEGQPGFERLIELGLEDALDELEPRARAGLASARDLGAARARVLAECEPQRAQRLSLYAGWVGPPSALALRSALGASQLEALARCPWQHFLRHRLRLEAAPDPLASVPQIDARLVGNTAHALLEALVRRALGAERTSSRSLAQLVAAGGRELRAAELAPSAALALECARVEARAVGLQLEGLIGVLAAAARAHAERALELDWGAGARRVLAAEVEGEARVALDPLGELAIAFRADRADLENLDSSGEQRVLRLVDYKSGKPISDKKKPETRAQDLRRALARGQALQAALYTLSGPTVGTQARGAYLYTNPEIETDCALAEVHAEDSAALDAARAALRTLYGALQAGAYAPRLEDARELEPAACKHCEGARACVRGDSLARARLRERMHGARAQVSPAAAERAASELWFIGTESETNQDPASATSASGAPDAARLPAPDEDGRSRKRAGDRGA
jgi:hypothetical protein